MNMSDEISLIKLLVVFSEIIYSRCLVKYPPKLDEAFNHYKRTFSIKVEAVFL